MLVRTLTESRKPSLTVCAHVCMCVCVGASVCECVCDFACVTSLHMTELHFSKYTVTYK